MGIYEFSGHTLDRQTGRLRLGDRDVALRPKSLSLLAYFVENPGRVIEKDELIAAVWPDVTVSDDSLSQCLKDIRTALGSNAEGLIRTVPRRGYLLDESRLILRDDHRSPVHALDPADDRPSIAVLPFQAIGEAREAQWFSDGIVEDITTALARSRQLFVVSRNFTSAYKGNANGIDEIARALGVRYVLEGSVRVMGDRVRVSTQLLEAATGGLLWVERFDRGLADIFAIQDEMTDAIVKHLQIELLPQERDAVQLIHPTNLEAYTYYRHGQQLSFEWTKSYLILARRMFSKAVELDPDFARAYAGIVVCESYLLEWHAADASPEMILAMAEKALALDDSLAEAHAARGFALHRCGRFDDAQLAYKTALTLDAHCYEALFLSAQTAWIQGGHAQAAALFAQAANLRQDDYVTAMFVMSLLERDDPQRLYWARECIARANRAAALRPESTAPVSRGAVALAHLGEEDKARSWIARAMALDPDDLVTLYNAASVFALLGEPDRAIAILEAYLPRVTKEMTVLLRNDRDFDSVRLHPRYSQLLATHQASTKRNRAGTPVDTIRHVF